MASKPASGSRPPSRESKPEKTIIVGVSGPSSSGKTTLARLLRAIFNPSAATPVPARSFIIHEDDFYKSDDQIPVTTTASGKPVEDWDTIDALNVSQLSTTLSYVRRNGELPADLKSKEDLNDATDSGVDDATVERLQDMVAERLRQVLGRRPGQEADGKADNRGNDGNGGTVHDNGEVCSLGFVDGFLLYATPRDAAHPLKPIQEQIHIPLFLPVPYTLLKERREGRTGYVTVGPAPTPVLKTENDNTGAPEAKNKRTEEAGKEDPAETDDDPPQQNFWTDPPGYVDDIVWPRYITDYSWLLLPDSQHPSTIDELKEAVGEGAHVREDVGVIVAPGKGRASMTEILNWAVEEIMMRIEQQIH